MLEHVLDDSAAMCEMRRVLAPTGIALIQVPIQGNVTDEDLTITDSAERGRRFGQTDHVRQYGSDFVNRLEMVGFTVEIIDFAIQLPQDTLKRFGLVQDELIYVCYLSGQAE